MTLVLSDTTHRQGEPQGAPVGSAHADPTGRSFATPAGPTPAFTPFMHRRNTMFQALYADLARAHRKRRQREFQRRLEVQVQHDMLLTLPRMLAR